MRSEDCTNLCFKKQYVFMYQFDTVFVQQNILQCVHLKVLCAPQTWVCSRFILPGMFPPKKHVSNTIIKQLVTPILFMPLQYPGAYFARTIVTVAGKVHNLVRLFMTILSQLPKSILQYFESQPALINISGQEQINFSMFYKSSVWCSQQHNKTSHLFKVNKIQDIIQKTTILPSHLIHYRTNILSCSVLYGTLYIIIIYYYIIIHIIGIHMVYCDFPYINKFL